jgi:hypothetical protein
MGMARSRFVTFGASALFTVWTACATSGCVSSAVARGTWIGALSGAAVGAGTGVLISNDKLLGSSKASELELPKGPSIGAGALIGTVFGAIVGAMIGHQNEDHRGAVAPAASTAREGATDRPARF